MLFKIKCLILDVKIGFAHFRLAREITKQRFEKEKQENERAERHRKIMDGIDFEVDD